MTAPHGYGCPKRPYAREPTRLHFVPIGAEPERCTLSAGPCFLPVCTMDSTRVMVSSSLLPASRRLSMWRALATHACDWGLWYG